MLLLITLPVSLFLPGLAGAMTPAGTKLNSVSSASCEFLKDLFRFDSNTVCVNVEQLNSVALDQPLKAEVKPGKTVSFAHTVTNRGNTADTFNLQATCPAGGIVQFFAADGVTPLIDSNGDGKIDTPLLAAGASLPIVVTLAVPLDAKPGDAALTVSVCSTADSSATASLVDTATVLSLKFWTTLNLTVSPVGQIGQGGELTYTLTFGIDPGMTATNVLISDQFDPNLAYEPGSATLRQVVSKTQSSYDQAARTVTWSIPSLPGGTVFSANFKARVAPTAGSDSAISNVIRISSDQFPDAQLSNAVSTPVVEQPLRINLTEGKAEAEVGEPVGYTVTVANISKGLTANDVQVLDSLPRGFRYAKGSSTLDGAPLPDPAPGTTVNWAVGALAPGQTRTLTYRALLSSDAALGDGINQASALGTTPGGNRLLSPNASAKVKVIEGVLNDKAIILGRVFVDRNGDLMPEENEPGLKGVRLYLENGFYAVTDAQGKFSMVGIEPGEHVLKLDRSSLPAGYQPVPLDSSFAGDGGSRFITVPFGGTARGDFGLREPPGAAPAPPEQKKGAAGEERVYTFGTIGNPGPPSLEEQIVTMPDSPEILEPARGAVLRHPWTDLVIRVPDETEYTLRVNGSELYERQIGKTIVESKRKIRICQYVGVRLEPGLNRLVLEVTMADGGHLIREVEVYAPGDAVKVQIAAEKTSIPADGSTVVPFSVTFLDKADHPVTGETIYTVVSEKGEVVEPDVDPATPGHQLKAVDGKGSFHLRAGLKSGPERLSVTVGSNLAGRIDLFFTPQLRDWIVAGLGSLKAGANSTSGKTENLDKDQQEGFRGDGRLAFFAKGTLFSQYLLTAFFDSKKKEQEGLFQRVPPDRYYPIYGDASQQGYDAESQKKYYLKVERDRSYLLVGDFNTNLSANEFSRYDRSLNGVKADLDSKNATLRAFLSSTNRSANRDQIPGNGTSGYYFLSKKPIVENSDKITIEVRDRYHTERVLSSTEKAPFTDYSLDYRTGALLFREPVPSSDANLNPIQIVALYESEDSGDNNHIYGGRGSLRLEQGSELGASAVVEENGSGSTTLLGVDGAWKMTEKSALKVEGARSNTLDKGEGGAYKAELGAKLDEAVIDAYFRRVDPTFQNLSMTGSEVGTEKYGAKLSYPLLEKSKVVADGFVQSDLINDTRLTLGSLGFSHKLEKFTLDAGYRFVEGPLDTGQPTVAGAPTTSTQMLFVGASGKLSERLEGSLLQEQAFTQETVKDCPSRTLIKLNYKLSEKTSAFVTEEIRESGSKGNNALFGVTSKFYDNLVLTTSYKETPGAQGERQVGSELSSKWDPTKELTFTTKTGYQLQDAMTGARGQALLGVDSSWEALKGLRLGAKAERTQLLSGTADPAGVNAAFALSAAYLSGEDLKATARYEYRIAPGETDNLGTLAGAWKLSESLSLLGKASYWTSDKAAGTDLLFDGQLGTAYRPLGKNSLYLLAMLRFKDDDKGSIPTGETIKSLIGSLEFSERPHRQLTIHGKYAGKYVWDTLAGQELKSFSDLILAGGTWDIGERWDLDLSAKLQDQYDTGVHSCGVIGELGYRVAKNVRVAAGYNLSRLNDRDLAGESYSSSGPFVQLKFKFDENTIGGLYQDLKAKPPLPPPPPPPAPAPAPKPKPVAMASVKAALSEEPVEILGSVPALKLLVNDREAAFQKGDVRLASEGADEVVERNGSDADRPLEFEIEASSPGEISSWKLSVATPGGEPIHELSGQGAPRGPVSWQISDEAALKGGETYQYRVALDYADGSRVSSPFRAFGINRTSSVAVSLTGGAFEHGSAVLSRQARAILKETALLLRKHPQERIVIEGHTDAVGSPEANLELSRKRSRAAADYLIEEEKIPAERLVVRWFGGSRPVASNAILEGRELNRRVEIRGELSEGRRAFILDQHRGEPYARINRSPAVVDSFGRFAGTLAGKGERIEVEMGNGDGRSVRKTLVLPALTLVEPAGGAARVRCPDQAGEGGAPSRPAISQKFAGKTAPGGSLSLNGKEVPVAADGSFSFLLELGEGEAGYWLEVRGPQGFSRHFRLAVAVEREKAPAAPEKGNE